MSVFIPYCNASFAETVTIEYDDVAHAIIDGVLGASCGSGIYSGSLIYSHIDGGYEYKIYTQNYAPFAYVVAELIEVCTTEITAATPTNATNEATANGIITITATGNGTKTYSIDGVSWQGSNVFSGLAPGTYTARVRNLFGGGYCHDSADVIVSFDALSVCDLELGNVTSTEGPGGTLTIEDYTTIHNSQPVEYRLDAGAWQNSPLFTGLASGTYNVQIRFRNFTACGDDRDVTLNACDLVLLAVDITHEQTRFGDDGQISITVEGTAAPYQYSINDGADYQASNLFTELAPGVYAVRVKDADDCEVFQSVDLNPFKQPVVVFPIANAHRVVITSGPVMDSGPQNFDNTLFADMRFPAREACCFKEPFSTGDIVPLQFRSSYAAHTLKVYNAAGVLQTTLTPLKKTSLMAFSEEASANFSNYGAGKTQIWFPTGLPNYFEVGQDVTITEHATLNGTYEIEDIVVGTLEAEGFQSLIITADYVEAGDPTTGTVSLTYNVEDYEVWEVAIDKAAFAAGEYYFIVTGTDPQFETFTARSEPWETMADTDELVLINHKNIESAFLIDYSTGIEHVLRVDGELLPVEPGGEREVMEDSRRSIVKLRENVTRQAELRAYDLPHWLAEKIKVAMAHDTVKLNGVLYQPTGEMTMEQADPTDNLFHITVKLRQVDFIAENSDDDGDVDATVLETEGGTLMELEP